MSAEAAPISPDVQLAKNLVEEFISGDKDMLHIPRKVTQDAVARLRENGDSTVQLFRVARIAPEHHFIDEVSYVMVFDQKTPTMVIDQQETEGNPRWKQVEVTVDINSEYEITSNGSMNTFLESYMEDPSEISQKLAYMVDDGIKLSMRMGNMWGGIVRKREYPQELDEISEYRDRDKHIISQRIF